MTGADREGRGRSCRDPGVVRREPRLGRRAIAGETGE